ncbi:MAG: division/cell wall cluster transcriptional repressor MraZ [Janthinobacterium lividum]
MALFLATHINKLDRKGRLSVPALFRTHLNWQENQQFVAFRSHRYQTIECCTMARLQHLSESVDQLALFSEAQDDLAATIFADAHQISIDGDGRITLPQDFIDHAALSENTAFVGCGATFQIWQPALFQTHQTAARTRMRGQQNLLHLKPKIAEVA